MRREQPRLFRLSGRSDNGCWSFTCPSWSGAVDPETGELAEYEVQVDTRRQDLWCSCPDAIYRGKQFVPWDSQRKCKHARAVISYCLSLIPDEQ